MTASSRWSGEQTAAIEPVMVRVPEGWFGMGCESGRDDEKPVHRVWVDAFELSAYQVTKAEYGCFLAAVGCTPPPRWSDPTLSDPTMPAAAAPSHAPADYSEWLTGAAR